MKKILFTLMVLALPLSAALNAAAAGNPSTYKVTIKKVQLKKTDGTWVTIAEPNQELDIAAANAGAVAGSMMSDSAVPAGNYVNFRVVVGKTMSVKGSDSASATCVGTHYTKNGGAITLTGTAASAGNTKNWTADPPVATTTLTETVTTDTTVLADQGEMTITLKLGAASGGTASDGLEIEGQTDLNPAIVIQETSAVSMSFSFDTQNTVHCQQTGMASYSMFFTPPGAGTAFSITVDGATNNITAANMQMAFPA
ncbi:MAG TPA: DUF4382 domain-containing protein [Elusimicrobiales bacterium]|nr:DUF4382 domain-containing protein [Elusimicrobiales bacterium]